ncbi:hypothetical protein ACRS3X_07895 [Ectopseudomonas hydrolytica]|uniref:hypothetical protein n=1 Tax=Ectopseudomonas hydrolytica TaxID=2493633 RepID=UPI003EDF07A4
MNAAQFEALAELLRMRDGASKSAARLVLVDGIPPSDAARQVGTTPQAVNSALRSCERGMSLVRTAAGL